MLGDSSATKHAFYPLFVEFGCTKVSDTQLERVTIEPKLSNKEEIS